MSTDTDFMFDDKDDSYVQHIPDFLPEYIKSHDNIDSIYFNQFKRFYAELIDSILNAEYYKTYELSDKSIDKELFISCIKTYIGDKIEHMYNTCNTSNFGITATVCEPSNPLMGTIELFMYHNFVSSNSMVDEMCTHLITYKTPLYFTYKNDEYVLITFFKQFSKG